MTETMQSARSDAKPPNKKRGERKFKPQVTHQAKTNRKAAWIFAPTMMLSVLFVYIFIGITAFISLSNWKIGTSPDFTIREPFGATYTTMMQDFRAQSSLRNIIIFTVLFLLVTMVAGLISALLIHHVAIGKGFFRTVFLLPYALSFIVTGVVWRWIFAPSTGINEILRAIGISDPPGWSTDPTILGSLNSPDGMSFLKVELGIPVAIFPVVFAAAWQLLGYAMAMYLAALASIPEEQLEAANVDGTNAWQRIRYVVLPQLWPATVTTLVLMLHVALKIFDLVVAMSGSGPGFVTDVPGIYIYDYLGSRYDQASAMAVVLLVITLIVIVPYLTRTYRRDKKG